MVIYALVNYHITIWLFNIAMENHHKWAIYTMAMLVITRGYIPFVDGYPKSSILIGLPIINEPFWGTPFYGNLIWLDGYPKSTHPILQSMGISGS